MALGFVAAQQLSSGELRHNLLQPMQQQNSLINSPYISKHLECSALIQIFTFKACTIFISLFFPKR